MGDIDDTRASLGRAAVRRLLEHIDEPPTPANDTEPLTEAEDAFARAVARMVARSLRARRIIP